MPAPLFLCTGCEDFYSANCRNEIDFVTLVTIFTNCCKALQAGKTVYNVTFIRNYVDYAARSRLQELLAESVV